MQDMNMWYLGFKRGSVFRLFLFRDYKWEIGKGKYGYSIADIFDDDRTIKVNNNSTAENFIAP